MKTRTHPAFPKIARGLYLYERTGVYYARVKVRGKQLTRSLRTNDRSLAKRLLIQLRAGQQQLFHFEAITVIAKFQTQFFCIEDQPRFKIARMRVLQ